MAVKLTVKNHSRFHFLSRQV